MSPMKETKNAAAAEYQAVEPSAPPAATGVPVSTGIPIHTANPVNATGAPQVVQNTTQQVVNINLTTPRVYYTVSWSTGLFDCADDIESCCITLWCPCVTFGMIAEVVDKGATPCVVGASIYTLIAFLSGCQCMYSCFYRTKLRAQYGLPESPCADCCVHCCCEACALCQNYRELKNRGFDMYIGYQANMQRKQSNAVTQPPVVQTGMIR